MKKFNDIESGLTEIENIDKKIVGLLEKEDYSKIIDELKNRLIVISQITSLKEKFGISSQSVLFRFEKIFSESSIIQTKLKEKQLKISERLDKHKKNKMMFRGRTY
jgi:uncharacterized protein YjgD (DUF1641 family)